MRRRKRPSQSLRESPPRHLLGTGSDDTSVAVRPIDPLSHTTSVAQPSISQHVLAIALFVAGLLVGRNQQAIVQVAIPDNIPDGSSLPPVPW